MTPDFSQRPRRASPIKWILLILLIAAAAWFFLLRSGAGAGKPTAAPADAAAEGEKKPTGPLELAAGDVASVSTASLVRRLPLSGSLTPLSQTTIKAKVGGELLEVRVREGQAVNKGEVLARIDTRNQQAQVASQRAGLEKAKADLALAKLNLENNQRLLQKNFIAQNVLDTSQSTYESAVANVKLAEAQLQLAEIGLHDAVVRAPFAGIISRRLAEPGEKVSSDSPLLGLVDLTQLELQASAPASEIPSVKPGQKAQVRVDGYGDQRFEATVARINPATEQGSRSILIYLSLDNSAGLLRGGMFAQGELVIGQSGEGPVVPVAAIRSEAGLKYVMAVVDGKLQQKSVKLGLSTEDNALVEVLEGLKPGDVVVVGRLDSLKSGTAVVLKSAAAPAAAGNGG
ncbi:efflux RND transporter periplasmic adaptor subunit [Stagnimonas aquatica]|uniref:Efflux RND transporter periplasmic adaptor subunit n=1 Tax=Stagnimonas aquatica TaxID=2689987 RepID=A0A3N0VED7_9GAMM|nr:efflux RND transporter periplasmic adaptor subunit [Stagnimonas aquatica]ROH91086.1 efflux RND transporter periplasmic adaptor subunit [Stagnimonas aquatica]